MDIHDEQLKNFFRPGRNIHSSQGFREQSLELILSHTQKQPSFLETIRREFLENMKFSLALGLAAVFVFIALGSLSNLGSVMPSDATRAHNELLSEAASLEFQIKLGEVSYFTQSADEIALIVESLKNNEVNNEALNIILDGRVF